MAEVDKEVVALIAHQVAEQMLGDVRPDLEKLYAGQEAMQRTIDEIRTKQEEGREAILDRLDEMETVMRSLLLGDTRIVRRPQQPATAASMTEVAP